MTLDAAGEETLNEAHLSVYPNRLGHICTDLELWNEGKGLTEAERRKQRVLTMPIQDEVADPYAGFEEMYYRQGGRLGGWQ